MKVTLLPSSVSPGTGPSQFLTTFLIDHAVAIDAGSLGLLGSTEAQSRVKYVFLTHSHMDHLASLPIFVENVFEEGEGCPTVYGGESVLECLRRDVFNDRLWPDFVRMSRPDSPFLKLVTLRPGEPVAVEGLRITPVEVDHVVPTLGVVVEGPGASVVIAGDTGPTDRIWKIGNAAPDLKAVFLEAAFPDEMAWLALAAKHLTPERFAGEVAKIKPGCPVLAVHLKPNYLGTIAAELAALGLPMVGVCEPGRTYEF